MDVSCPSASKCSSTVVPGVATCQCPTAGTHLVNNSCVATLANSDWLDPHNSARAAVGSASLVWSASLAQLATAWAQNLAANYSCQLLHPEDLNLPQPYGQNLAKASYDPSNPNVVLLSNTDAVNLWVVERTIWKYSIFDGISSGCTTGSYKDCGHYTQLVWNTTLSVGCGSATCATTTKSKIWACDYSPNGNIVQRYPYYQDPCFQVRCPSPATCKASSSGSGVCSCPTGQVLVSGQCIADPCLNKTCPGTQTCNSTTGSAICGCPSGTVASGSSSTTCTPLVCIGASCPSTATCTATSSSVPVCSCPTGKSFTNDGTTCVSTTVPKVPSTSVALYNATNYAGAPALLRIALGNCVNIPPAYAGKIQSFKIALNLNEALTAGSTASPCTDGVFFCPASDCNPKGTTDCTSFSYLQSGSGLDKLIANAFSLLC